MGGGALISYFSPGKKYTAGAIDSPKTTKVRAGVWTGFVIIVEDPPARSTCVPTSGFSVGSIRLNVGSGYD